MTKVSFSEATMRRSGFGQVGGGINLAALGAVRSAVVSETHPEAPEAVAPLPFVTISRQAGAGGRSLAEKLAQRLNQIDPAKEKESPWAAWDHQLVEKVAKEHGIDAALVTALEIARQPWFSDLLSGLNTHPDPAHPDQFAVYKETAATVRGLAKVGRSILVGRASVFITRDLPGGVHVRLVAPRAYRIKQMAAMQQVSEAEAAKTVDQIDRARQYFFRQHWPSASLDPENFTITLNSEAADDETLAESIVPFVKAKMLSRVKTHIT
jgi:cytidylate kinase